MTVTRWGFEIGANNDALSATNADTDYVVITGGTAVISATQAFEGTRAALMSATTTSGGTYLQKNLTATPQIGLDTFIYVAALPTAETSVLWVGNAAARQCSLALAIDGKIRIRDGTGGGGANLWTSTAALATNTWYRVSLFATQDATNGTIRAAFYAGSSTIALDDSTLLTARNTGSLPYDAMRIGPKATTNTLTMSAYFDYYGYDRSAVGLLPIASAPEVSATISSPVGLIDATASIATGASYSISQTAGPSKTPTVVAVGKWMIAVDNSQDTVWTVAVTQSDSQVDTTTITVPSVLAQVPPVELLYATGPGTFV